MFFLIKLKFKHTKTKNIQNNDFHPFHNSCHIDQLLSWGCYLLARFFFIPQNYNDDSPNDQNTRRRTRQIQLSQKLSLSSFIESLIVRVFFSLQKE